MYKSEDSHIKKWYILKQDKHEGPYSKIELRDKLQFTNSHSEMLFWTEGMPDWQPLQHISNLEDLFTISNDSSINFVEEMKWTSNLKMPSEPNPETFKSTDSANSSFVKKIHFKKDFSQTQRPFQVNTPISNEELPSLNQLIRIKAKGHLAYLFRKMAFTYYRNKKMFLTAIIGTALLTYQFAIRPQSIDDVALSIEQKRELLSTMKLPKNAEHPAFTLAKVDNDLQNPYFYIATNLNDESQLTLVIEGIPETLTDQFYFKMYSDLEVQNGWVKTPPLRQKNGEAIAQGEYRFLIKCKNCPDLNKPTSENLFERTLFLGGKKDQTYDNKLRLYHLQLRRQAQSEIQDIRQIAETLEKQLNDTAMEFEQILRKSQTTPSEKLRQWKSFDTRWTHLQNQLDLLYNTWTPEHLSEKIFYGEMYSKLRTAASDIKNIHSKQNSYLQGKGRDDQQEYEIASDISLVQSAIQQIRIKSNLTERLPASANGMPQRLTTEL